MPNCWPVWIAEYICATLLSRIRLRMAGVPIMISCAATRPAAVLGLDEWTFQMRTWSAVA